MGIGFDTNEENNDSPSGVYPSVVDNLVTSGIIQRRAFSLYLNDLQANKGAVVFGGIDTTKFTGPLVALPFQAGQQGLVSEYYVTLTSVSYTDASGSTTQLSPDGYAQAALLDSGTTNTLLTNDVFGSLGLGLGAVGDPSGQGFIIPCSLSGDKGTINYSFGGDGGVTIKVPVADIVGLPAYSPNDFNDPSGACELALGTLEDGGGVSILGDSFLRSAYAVYDQDNSIGALAQAQENEAATSNIVVIPSGTAIPSATFTATAIGTQVSDVVAQTAVPPASFSGSSLILAGTPTFNLGSSTATATAGGGSSGSSSSSGAANHAAVPTAAILGLGLAVGMMGF